MSIRDHFALISGGQITGKNPDGAWLDAVHIPRTLLECPDAFMPRQQIYAFGTLATRESGFGELTFVAGQRIGVDEMGRAGRAICAAPTLHKAIEAACRSLRDESSKFSLFCENAVDGIQFCRGRVRTDPRTRTVIELYDLALMVNIVRLALGPDWCPEEIALQTASWARGCGAIPFHKDVVRSREHLAVRAGRVTRASDPRAARLVQAQARAAACSERAGRLAARRAERPPPGCNADHRSARGDDRL